MTLENNRAPLLYYIKLCASFQIHWWIQIGVSVRKRSIWVKIGNCMSRVTLKLDRWPRKTIGHLFYFASSFVHHFTAISEFKLQLESGNAQFWSKSTIFFWRVTLKFNGWPCKTKGHLFYAISSFVHHFIPIGELQFELQSSNAQFGSKSMILSRVTYKFYGWPSKNYRASLLCYFKLCVSFRTHWWIQIGVTVKKRSMWVKFYDFLELCDLES